MKCFKKFFSRFFCKKLHVGLDLGHGGASTGAVYRSATALESDIIESKYVLEFGKSLFNYFSKNKKIKIHLSRWDDVNLSFEDRAKKLNFCDLVISLHLNAFPVKNLTDTDSPKGLEIYIKKEDEKARIYVDKLKPHLTPRRVYEIEPLDALPSYHWLRRPRNVINKYTTPALLVELGYVTNPIDRIKLREQHVLQRTIASGLQELRTYISTYINK